MRPKPACTPSCKLQGTSAHPLWVQMKMLSIHTGHPVEKIERDTARTRYFSPYEAVDYHIIDSVLDPTAPELRAIAESAIYL